MILTLWLLLGLPGASRAEDWPRWRGPRGDGTWKGPAIPPKWPPQGPPVVWKQQLGPGYSGITEAEGRVFTLDRPWQDAAQKTPGDAERIVCLDAATGALLWQHRYSANYEKVDYGKGPRCTPTMHDGRVYTLGAVGHVHCLEAASGREIWSLDLVKEKRAKIPEWGLAASPVIQGDLVILHGGVPGACYLGLNRFTGQEIWRAGDDPAGYATPILIDHAGVRQLVGWTPLHVLGIRATDGKILWKIPYKVTYGVSIATPIFQDGVVLVCGYWEGSKAIQLGAQPDQAEILWEENTFLRGLMDPPLYRDGYGYLLDKQHGLVGFSLKDGKKLWMDGRLTPRGRNPQVSLVWLGESQRAIALNEKGELTLLELTPRGLTEHSRAKIVGDTWAHPAYAGEFAYARDDEQIVCVKLTAPNP